MYLLYVDESGTHKGSGGFEHFVMGGVALRDEDVYPFSRAVAGMQRKVVPKHSDLELHATDIVAGRGDWSAVPQGERLRLLDEGFDLLHSWTSSSGSRPVYFGVVVHRRSHVGKDLLELAHVELFRRFDTLLSRLHLAGDSHRSLVVADNSSYEKILQKLVPQWKLQGTSIGKLHSLVEVPLYVDSKASKAVQMADWVAWACFNYYERGHTRFMQRLNDRFDANDGIQHGLAHFTKEHRRCPCVPCESRRHRVIASNLAPWPLSGPH